MTFAPAAFARALPGLLAAVLLALASMTLVGCASSRTAPPPTAPTAQPSAATAPATTAASAARARPATGMRPFAEAVRGTRPDSGLFTLHRSDTKLLFQVPDTLLGRDLLLVSSIAAVPAGLGGFIPAGYKAQEQVIRFERRGDRLLLRKQTFEQVAADSLPIALSVVSNNFAPILAALPLTARGADSASSVVDVTALFERDVPAISGLDQAQRTEFGVRRLDETRSFINYGRAFPINVDVRHTLTFEATKPPSNADAGTISLEMHQSLVLLPRTPMRPRIADARVGYFSVNRVNFGAVDQAAVSERFIRRWRMEPSDPAAYARGEAVEPVKPIVYYLDPATPAEWRACVIKGVEDWRGPFEKAGFKNAIQARIAPTPEEDPEWSPEDVRYSVVRWAASLTRNAQGPSVSDPRSGEIIESDIVWYHNHLRSYRNRILLETGAANPLARSLPIDGGLMCEAMRAVIAHEVGHALGFPHNMGASSAYPIDSLRSPAFARRMGLSPSIMDYARQNYVAQPGDGLVGSDFIRRMGPYDDYAVNWGYRALPDAPTPEAERATLHRWIVEKAGDPVYRFNGGGSMDPSAQTEDIGNDPVEASRLGIANLKRVAPNLLAWTTRPGDDYADYEELYGELVGQWARYVGHVVTLVGGVREDLKTADQAGAVYTSVPRARQEEALRFLAAEVFEAPTWLVEAGALARIEATGGVERIGARGAAVLGALLAPDRLLRLIEAEARGGRGAYPVAAYLNDVKAAVWGAEVGARPADLHRRGLQRVHVDRLEALVVDAPRPAGAPTAPAGPGAAPRPDVRLSDVRPLARAQLREIGQEAAAAARRTRDPLARAHFEDVAARAERILEGPRV